MVWHETLDQYLQSWQVLTRSIQRFRRYRLLKTLTKNLKFCYADAKANTNTMVSAIALPSYRWANNAWWERCFCKRLSKGIYAGHVPIKASSHGPRQANLVLIAYASSKGSGEPAHPRSLASGEGSGEPAHPRSLARTFAARSYKQWVKRNLQTESQIPGPSEWLCMRS